MTNWRSNNSTLNLLNNVNVIQKNHRIFAVINHKFKTNEKDYFNERVFAFNFFL